MFDTTLLSTLPESLRILFGIGFIVACGLLLAGAVFLYHYVSDSLRNIWLELVEPFAYSPPPGTITDRTLFIGDRVSVGLHVASPVVGERVRKWSRKWDGARMSMLSTPSL